MLPVATRKLLKGCTQGENISILKADLFLILLFFFFPPFLKRVHAGAHLSLSCRRQAGCNSKTTSSSISGNSNRIPIPNLCEFDIQAVRIGI